MTVPMQLEGLFFEASDFGASDIDEGRLPQAFPPPIAGRQAIRAALRHSLSKQHRSVLRSPGRVNRLRLAAGRGAVALEQASTGTDAD